MYYRKFGRHDIKVSNLGFGCMRFPLEEGAPTQDSHRINENEAIRMLRYAIDNGVNYVDTAYMYHKGESEGLVAKALKDGYRERVFLADKLPVWLVKEPADFDRLLNEQLERLETDYIDMYLLHALNKRYWKICQDNGALEFLDRALTDGRIRYAGFSYHDGPDLFKEIVDAYPWSFCQIQYNYLDESNQAGRFGLEYAADKGLAVVIMEPLLGGKLAGPQPSEVQAIFDQAGFRRTAAQWALRWVWNHREVTTVLSGMSTFAQVEENLETARLAYPGSLGPVELATLEAARNKYLEKLEVPCTQCNYCLPCDAKGINIPQLFELYNQVALFGGKEEAQKYYQRLAENQRDASCCVHCGLCEVKCPQGIEIPSVLKRIQAFFGDLD